MKSFRGSETTQDPSTMTVKQLEAAIDVAKKTVEAKSERVSDLRKLEEHVDHLRDRKRLGREIDNADYMTTLEKRNELRRELGTFLEGRDEDVRRLDALEKQLSTAQHRERMAV